MKRFNGLVLAIITSGVLIVTAGSGIAQDRRHQDQLVQNTRGVEGSERRLNRDISFDNYLESYREAQAEKARELRQRYAFENKYAIGEGE